MRGFWLAGAITCALMLAVACQPAAGPTPAPPTPPPAVTPVARASPTPAPAGTASPTTPPRAITLTVPAAGATIASPVEVQGSVVVSPFESTLRGRVYDGNDQVVGEGPIQVDAEMGQAGRFAGHLSFASPAGGPGRVEVAELSPKDGSVLARATVAVTLAAGGAAGVLEVPAADARVTLPLHVLARVGDPDQQVQLSLRWQDGTELARSYTTLRGEDGRGLLATSLDWNAESQPPRPPTQPAMVEVRNNAGAVLARQQVEVLAAGGADTQEVSLFWVLGDQVQPVQRSLPRTERIGAAALEELLWGPTSGNAAGFHTELPLPAQVLGFPGRGPDWGPRATLRGLIIEGGVATANFSRELRAYGGGSLRVKVIREQITRTLTQFPSVREVRIAIEGQTEAVLEP